MESVDALRKWANGLSGIWIDPNDHSIIVATCDDMPPSMDCVNLREHVNEILDGIEREVKDALLNVHTDLMDADEWMRYPVDADGVPIHVGDVMEWPDGKTFEVVGIGDGTLFYVEGDDDALADWTGASTKRHHHAPTVEDVLREMLDAWGELPSNVTNDAIVAEYASKLRLAGDE